MNRSTGQPPAAATAPATETARRKPTIFLALFTAFLLLLAAALGGFLLVARGTVDRTLAREETARAARVADRLARSPYLASPDILREMAALTRMEFLVLDPAGGVRAATVADPQRQEEIVRGATTTPLVSRDLAGGGRLVVLADPATRLQLRARLQRRFLMVGCILLAGGGLVAWFLARRLSRPLAALAAACDRIARGERGHPAPAVGGYREAARLARAFSRMQEQQRAYEKQLVENEKLALAGRVAGALSHELKNPLTAIKMFVQVLRGRAGGQKDDHRLLQLLESEIDRLAAIVDQVSGRLRADAIQPRPTDLAGLVDEVLTLARPMLERSDITLQVRIPPGLPLLDLDPERIKQVCWNLLLNGRDAMAGGGELTVALAVDEEHQMVRLTVADRGNGLPAGDPAALLAPFTSTKEDGLGLGLATSSRIVAAHGGQLLLANRDDGPGAVATVLLPLPGTANTEGTPP